MFLFVFFFGPIFIVTPAFADYYSSYSVSTDVGHPSTNPAPNNNQCPTYDPQNHQTYAYPLPNPHHINDLSGTAAQFARENFADPNCELIIQHTQQYQSPYDKTPIENMIYQLDPKYADIWINFIIPTESNWDANIIEYSCLHSTCAWGLFQMNLTGYATSGQYDNGSVYWKQQISNAINLNRHLDKTPGSCGAGGGKYCDSQAWCYFNSAPKNILCRPL